MFPRPAVFRWFVALAMAAACTGLSGPGRAERQPLRFLANAGLAPVVFADAGQARGVAVDLVLAAAREAGLDIHIEAMDWQQAQAEMKAGRADGLIHINPTPERLQTLAFSAPLLASHFHIFRRIERLDIRDLASLTGRRVGVEQAGFPAQFLARHPEVRTEFVPSWQVGFARLARGELDAVFVDRWAGDYALSQVGAYGIVAVEPAVVEDSSRVAVAKGRTELLSALDRGLAAIDANGKRQTILRHWSGQEVLHLTRETVERNIVLAAAALAAAVALLTLLYAARLRRLNAALRTARDVQARALADAGQANGQMEQAQRIARVGSWEIDLVTGRLVCSLEMRRLVDAPGEAPLSLASVLQKVHADDQEALCSGYRLAREQGEPLRVRCRVLSADSEVRHLDLIGECRRASGAIVGLLGTAQDVTAEVRSARELERSEQRFQAVVDSQSESICRTGADGRLLLVNPQFCRTFGIDAAAAVGQGWRPFVHPDDLARVEAALRSLSPSSPIAAVENRVLTATQGVRWMEFVNRGFFDEQGRLTEVQCVGRDITARKLAEDELQRHRQTLEALVGERTAGLSAALELAQSSNRAKTSFLAMMNHELRTPLNAILGLTPLVRRRITDPHSQEHLAKVEAAGQRLLTLVDDLLDTSRIEADRLHIESVPMRLSDILARVEAVHAPQAAQRGLRWQVEAPAALLARRYRGDPLRIEQVLGNLAGNAIKFTAQGSVRIWLGMVEAAAGPGWLRMEVVDTGIGISAEDQARIFAAFEQVDASLSRRYGGAGLGLALCKRLVTQMGGRIGVTSEPGQGSCFWFELPLDESDPAIRSMSAPQSGPAPGAVQ